MKKKQILFLILFNIILSIGFYIDNLGAFYTDVSSDSANIIPVCLKIDNPELYKGDLYLDQISNVEYYTPFFVESLRFCANFTDGNYLQAQNILGVFIHFIHGILWFLLFYNIKKDYWIALLMMLITKGVIWPPGGELMGVTELWTIMPRTFYTALLPLPFLLYKNLSKFNLIFSAFALGFILNFHPLSGIGGIVMYLSAYLGYLYFEKKIDRSFLKNLFLIGIFCLIGMFPYLYVYLTKVKTDIIIDKELFELAFNKRIPSIFSNPIDFIKQWNRPILYFYLLSFILFYFLDNSKSKKIFKILLFTSICIFLSANLSVYIEQITNYLFDKSIRMSFQLIRYQKFILVIFQISLFLLFTNLFTKFRFNDSRKFIIFISFYIVLMFADVAPLNKIPFIGDDICSTTIPNSLKFRTKEIPQEKIDFNQMLDYIQTNTNQNDIFYGSFYIRYACKRPVIMDGKGASMIIEGNPHKLIEWYMDTEHLNKLTPKDKINFLRSKNVSYILSTDDKWDFLESPIKTIGNSKLYKI
ncbi:MAG: hypothetical protein Q4B43_07275 [Bacteroidota bacterium]|nr:hypothetical protein [Bacteroidota bacterium]